MSADRMFAGVMVPEEIVAKVDAQREVTSDGKKKGSLNHAVVKYVEALLANTLPENSLPPFDVERRPVTTADACEVIMSKLDDDHQRLIRTFARERKLPIEAFIMSPLVRSKDRGETNLVMHDWLKQPPQPQAPEIWKECAAVCEHCHKPFQPTYEGQRFCPPPADESDSCGRLWGLLQAREAVERRRRPPSQFAPPSGMRLRTTADRINSSLPVKP